MMQVHMGSSIYGDAGADGRIDAGAERKTELGLLFICYLPAKMNLTAYYSKYSCKVLLFSCGWNILESSAEDAKVSSKPSRRC